jgi:hypothetical protein
MIVERVWTGRRKRRRKERRMRKKYKQTTIERDSITIKLYINK